MAMLRSAHVHVRRGYIYSKCGRVPKLSQVGLEHTNSSNDLVVHAITLPNRGRNDQTFVYHLAKEHTRL